MLPKKPDMNLLLQLFVTFAKIGLFTFGGGYAMISIIEDTCVEKNKWITHEEMMDITVIAESTPGPIAINCATYIGHKQAGIAGSVVATIGIVLPSFLIIYVLSGFLDGLLALAPVANAFRGIKVGVGLLILRVAVNMVKKMPPKAFPRMVAGCAFVAVLAANLLNFRLSSIVLMITAGAVSFVRFRMGADQKGGAGK